MSFSGGKQPESEPVVANVENDDVSTNEEAVPVPWWIGPRPCPLTWIVPEIYNLVTVEVKKKVSKKKVTVGYDYYGDVAGIAGVGLADRIDAIESAGKRIWPPAGEAGYTRPDQEGHPSYWRHKISIDKVGDFYIYWGRENQPTDDVLLAPLAKQNPALSHPAYRGQILVVIKKYYFGMDTNTVPNTRIWLHRSPRVAGADFPRQLNATQGESIVAGIAELMTNQRFGAGIPARHFDWPEWEKLSEKTLETAGAFAPDLDRAAPLKDTVADLLAYYDGGIRIANTLLLPFAFPHDGKQPDNPGLLTQHDFTELPEFTATAPSKVVNEVKVKHRDAGADFKERLAIGSSVDNIEARRTSVKSSTVTLPGIIDPAQAAAWASRASASFSAGALEMSVTVRPPRAVNADDDALRAGDLVQITWDPLGINRLMRITRRRDAWAAGVDLDLESEHGFFGSLPPVEIARPPTLGESVPDPVVRARVFELDRQLLEAEAVKNAGAEDIFAAFLAMRPKSRRRNDATFEGQDVSGFQIWDSPDGSSYDPLGSQTYWAVRATLKTAVLPGDVATPINVNVDIDPANIDRERIVFQSESSRRNDTLLLVLDNEIFSIGAITLAQQNGMDWTLACLRARRGSAAAAHAAGAEAWLVYRDEITPHTHGDWEPGEQRFFKLQPSTPDETLDLEDAPVLKYTFAQAAAPLPVQITLGNLPSTARTMTELAITATVDAPSANLATVEVVLIRIQEGNAAQLQTSLGQWTMRGDGKAHWDVACAAIPIVAGNYRVEIRATVDSGQMTATASGVVVVTTGESGTGGSESLLGSYLNFRNSLSPVTLMPGDTEVYSAPLSIDLLGPNDKWLLVSWSIFVQCWGTNADITISLMPMLDGRYHATSFNFLAIREGRLAPENDRAITIHGETVVPIYWMDGLLGDAWAIEFRNDSDRNYHTGNDYAVKRYSVNISIKRWTGVPPT